MKKIDELRKQKENQQEKERIALDQERMRIEKERYTQAEEERILAEKELARVRKENQAKLDRERELLLKAKIDAEEEEEREKERILKERKLIEENKEIERQRILRLQLEEEEEKEREFQYLLKKKKEEKEAKERERLRLLAEQEEEEEQQAELARLEIKKKELERQKKEREAERLRILKEQEEEEERREREFQQELEKQKLLKEKKRKEKEDELQREKEREEELERQNILEEQQKQLLIKKEEQKKEKERQEEIEKQMKNESKKPAKQKMKDVDSDFDDSVYESNQPLKRDVKEISTNHQKDTRIQVKGEIEAVHAPTQIDNIINKNNENIKQKSIEDDVHETEETIMQPPKNNPKEMIFKNVGAPTEEIYYHSLFSQYSSVFQEKTYTYRRRRNAILQNQYFNEYIMGENNLIDKAKQILRRYYLTQEQQFLSSMKEIENFYEIFTPFLQKGTPESYVISIQEIPANCYNSCVSPLLEVQDLIGKLYKQVGFKTLKYYRAVEMDGNSFYRSFLFCWLEYNISTNKPREIQKLILDIYKIVKEKISEEEEKKGSIDNFFKIMHEILRYLEKNKREKAHSILLSAFNASDNCFNLVLDIYLRNLMYLIAEDFQNDIISRSQIKIRKALNNTDKEEIDDINLMLFVNNQNEAFKMALQIIPMIFNVNLILNVVDGAFSSNSSLKCSTEAFNCMTIDPKMKDNAEFAEVQPPFTIQLLYNLSGYYPVYEESNPAIQLLKSKNILNVEQIEFYSEESKPCNKCKMNDKVYSIPIYGISFCGSCTKGTINSFTKKRASFLNKENYHSREFYCRGFEIFPGIFINEPLYSHLFKESIGATLVKSLKNLCFMCDEIKEEGELLQFDDCLCQFCNPCLSKHLIDATQGAIVLNKFDKILIEAIHKIPKKRCVCNEIFNVDKTVSLLKIDVAEKKVEAAKRMKVYIQTYCLLCINVKRGQDDVGTDNTRDVCKLLKVIEDGSHDCTPEEQHVICLECIEKIKELDNKEDTSEFKTINCQVCQVEHKVSKEVWKSTIYSSSCNCLIL